MKKNRYSATMPNYWATYTSPIGLIIMTGTVSSLTGLWFEGQRNAAGMMPRDATESDTELFHQVRYWLDVYFSGSQPDFLPAVEYNGTVFQQKVWQMLQGIPYGETVTYGEIAKQIAKDQGLDRMSAQAVGQAVGCNPISIIVPCHRVLGKKGALTGYAGGIWCKEYLLKLERVNSLF